MSRRYITDRSRITTPNENQCLAVTQKKADGEKHLISLITYLQQQLLFNMASSAKKKVRDSKCSREFQTWWAEKYGMINKGGKAVSVSCSGSVKRYHYKKLQIFLKLEKKYIKDLDAQEKRNEETVIDEFNSVIDSLIKKISAIISQFKELSETFRFIMYHDVISFYKLNLSQFDSLEIEKPEMQLIDFQSSSIWIQKFIETRKKLELIEEERLSSNISKNASNEILETWNSIPDAFNCLKKLAYTILTIFSSTYACESLFSEINNIKDSLSKRLKDDSNSACILLKITSYNHDISYLSSNLQQQKSY
ncbi:dimer_Tnp_hAT domain-containing protein [Trichonephila clavipes]|nr:dimer_Tnp_hAT domain-containing protein [Trichonephila clavipes]